MTSISPLQYTSNLHSVLLRCLLVSRRLCAFCTNGTEQFLIDFLHTYYTFLCTLEYTYFSSYIQLWRSYAILSVTT